MKTSDDGWLVLKDGRAFRGRRFGATGDVPGEVVFNTSMTGYQEVLTDASYAGQIVTMTYPLIGNVGINVEDHEVEQPAVRGMVIRELCEVPSNYRSNESLRSFLERSGIAGIQCVDTRALTRHIRQVGAMMGLIASQDRSIDELRQIAAELEDMEGTDLVKEVTCKHDRRIDAFEASSIYALPTHDGSDDPQDKPLIAVMDFGIKLNILRCLLANGMRAHVFPATTTAEEILAINPDGIFLSNGPGDPAAVTYAVETVRALLGSRPMFGICLGHQILALALGGKTFKLKFGHHGTNHPVIDESTGKIEITSQNHGFGVDPGSFDPADVEMTHRNLNDGTVEGLRSVKHRAFSVQYHPEACPGPHDAFHYFARFRRSMEVAACP